MAIAPVDKKGPTGHAVKALSTDDIKKFTEDSGIFDDFKSFTAAKSTTLKGDAKAKFDFLAAQKDSWSGLKNEPKVFTADINGTRTVWLTVENDHGDQAYVFDAHGKALATGFMPETGDTLTWEKGFKQPSYVKQ